MHNSIAKEIKVLLFHRVSPVRDPLWDPMDPILFRKIIAYIARKYEIFFIEELHTIDFSKVKKPIAALTFDDGYYDFLEYALPIMQEYRAKSSLYIVTDCINKNEATWTYNVDYLFNHTQKIKLDLGAFQNNLGEFSTTNSNSKDELIQYGKKLKQFLKKVPNNKRQEIIEHIKTTFDDVALPSNMMLSWEQLKQFDKNLVCIGSHTKSHPPLATIDNEEELLTELQDSYNQIHSQLGYYPYTISYPVGSYNQKVIECSKKVGYQMGLAVDFKIYNPKIHTNFTIPRLELYNESYIKTLLRAEGIYYKIKNLFKS